MLQEETIFQICFVLTVEEANPRKTTFKIVNMIWVYSDAILLDKHTCREW